MTTPESPETTTPHRLRAADLPARFGRYELVSVLGTGGMGKVFGAVMTGPSGFRKDVALKVIRPRDDDAPTELDEEARIGALLKHPHIVDIYDFGERGGTAYISMEMVRGLDLATLAARATLAPAQIAQVGAAIAAGLQHAHELEVGGVRAGLVHRDLKPSNVLVSRDGVTKVVDFGIAKLQRGGQNTETGVAKGTPAYMSPEQAAADDVDHRSDLWSLGAILYELATRETLLTGMTVIELMMSLLQVQGRLAKPETLGAVDTAVPGLARIVGRCLAEDREDRYPDAAAVEADLETLRRALPPAPSLRALVRDVLAGGDGGKLIAAEAVTRAPGLGTSTIADRPRHNLPKSTSSFLGRAGALESLTVSLEQAGLVTLLGPGGTGKTRLALEAARGFLQGRFGGAAWFVGAQDARDGEGLLRAVGAVLTIPWSRADEGAQIDRIGHALAAGGDVLLVLDNLEQLVEHAVTPVTRWLSQAPRLRIVATSRERLRAQGEQVIELGPLSQDDAEALFVARAAQARRGFAPSDKDMGHIAEIVRRLDRLPLAIELAAARTAMLPVDRIALRLNERFRLLRSRDRGTSRRQATLEDAIGWSWDLLSPAEHWTLAWCSVFRGGFQVVQAEDLVSLHAFEGAPWVLETVETLREKSLLYETDGVDGTPRFRMYESIRAFAAHKLAELGAQADARAAAGEVLGARARELRELLQTGDAVDAMREIAQEEDNLFAVLETCESAERRAEVALTLIRHLSRRGPQSLLVRVFEQGWALRDAVGPALRAELMSLRAQTIRMGAIAHDGQDWSWQALAIAYDAGETALAARLSIHVGYDLNGEEGAERAIVQLERARGDLRRLGTPAGEAFVVSALATATAYSGRREEGTALHREALAMHDAAGSDRMVGVDAVAIGTHFALDGDLQEARHWFDRGQSSFQRAGDLLSQEICLTNLTHLELELGNLDAARRAGERSRRARERLGLLTDSSLTPDFGVLAYLDGDAATARATFARGFSRTGKESRYAVGALGAYSAMMDALEGESDGLARRLEDAADAFGAAGSAVNAAMTLANAAGVSAMAGDRAEAVRLLERAQSATAAAGGAEGPVTLRVAEAQLELLAAREGEDVDAMRAGVGRLLAGLEERKLGVHLLLGTRLLRRAYDAG